MGIKAWLKKPTVMGVPLSDIITTKPKIILSSASLSKKSPLTNPVFSLASASKAEVLNSRENNNLSNKKKSSLGSDKTFILSQRCAPKSGSKFVEHLEENIETHIGDKSIGYNYLDAMEANFEVAQHFDENSMQQIFKGASDSLNQASLQGNSSKENTSDVNINTSSFLPPLNLPKKDNSHNTWLTYCQSLSHPNNKYGDDPIIPVTFLGSSIAEMDSMIKNRELREKPNEKRLYSPLIYCINDDNQSNASIIKTGKYTNNLYNKSRPSLADRLDKTEKKRYQKQRKKEGVIIGSSKKAKAAELRYAKLNPQETETSQSIPQAKKAEIPFASLASKKLSFTEKYREEMLTAYKELVLTPLTVHRNSLEYKKSSEYLAKRDRKYSRYSQYSSPPSSPLNNVAFPTNISPEEEY